MILYRHADPRYPFLWESSGQEPARWHAEGEGPVQYFADTPDGAWAEFVRHEGIREESELENVRRALWAVDVPESPAAAVPRLSRASLTGGLASYAACRKEARRLRAKGATSLRAPSAALLPNGALAWRVDEGLRVATKKDGAVIVLFGARPELTGWLAAFAARPHPDLLRRVRAL